MVGGELGSLPIRIGVRGLNVEGSLVRGEDKEVRFVRHRKTPI